MDWLLHPPAYIQVGLGAATGWRLAVLLVYEGGPFHVVARARALIGIQHDDDGRPTSYPDGPVAALVSCVWCMTLWTTLAVYGILWAAPYVVVVLGTWAAATYLEALRPRS